MIEEANASQYLLIGEVHGINEIPLLIDGLTKQVPYRTFIAEIDPWLAQILEQKAYEKSLESTNQWYGSNNQYLSFYSYQADFKLLQTLASRNIKFAGIDQITLLNDVPVYEHLAGLTRSKTRKASYQQMASNSRQMLDEMNAGKHRNLYLPSQQFKTDAQKLKQDKLSAEEVRILEALEISHAIYNTKTGHYRRINLMKQQLMDYYQKGLLKEKNTVPDGGQCTPREAKVSLPFSM